MENSMLMSQLHDMGLDLSKYNQFPQLDNLKNTLKFMGIKLKPDIFNYSTMGFVDEIYKVLINNVEVEVSIPELRFYLIMFSYFMQYKNKQQIVDMDAFFSMIDETDLFQGCKREYVESIYEKFMHILPILQQLKQYA